MGEIADALRNLQSDPGLAQRLRTPEVASLALPVRQAMPGKRIPCVQPSESAIVAEGGTNVEACRQLALAVRSALEARRARSVAIVGALRGDGKTTVSCNLALALASLSRTRSVALVDLDLRRPSIERVLGLGSERGIEGVLHGQFPLEDACVSVETPALDVYPALEQQRAAHQLLGLPAFASLVAALEARYSLVIFDTPPALLVPDASLLLQHVAVCIPVARAGTTRTRSVEQMIARLPASKILGELLNAARPTSYARKYSEYYYLHEPDAERGAKR